MAKVKAMTWEEFDKNCAAIEKITTARAVIEETAKERTDRKKKALANFEYFQKRYLAHFAKTAPAPWHLKLAKECEQDPTFKGIVEGHRGSAKSVLATLLIPLWLKLKGELKVMVLVGETEIKAQRLLATLQAELKSNALLIRDFGNQVMTGDWEKGEFVDSSGVAYFAISIRQDPSGIRYRENRPDYIVVDDVDNKKRCKNPTLVREVVEWIQEDLMGCFDIGAERFILVNSTKSKISVMEGMKQQMVYGKVPAFLSEADEYGEDEEYVSTPTETKPPKYVTSSSWSYYHVPAVDKLGNPTWPAKYSREYWKAKQKKSNLRAWKLNYMCEVVVLGKTFKAEWIRYEKILPLDQYDDLIIYCDPAWKSTPTACYKAVKFWARKGTRLQKIKAFVRQCSVSSMVRYFYDLYEAVERADQNTGPFRFKMDKPVHARWMMEANMLQDLLLDEFAEEGERRGYQLPIVGDRRSKGDKMSRIVATSALYERGFITYNIDEKDDPDMQRAEEHLLAVEEGTNTPLDSPDADEGGIWYLQRSGRTSKAPEPRIGKRQHKNAH